MVSLVKVWGGWTDLWSTEGGSAVRRPWPALVPLLLSTRGKEARKASLSARRLEALSKARHL